jgi:hypothetical protein
MTSLSCLKSGVVFRLTLGEKLGVKGMRCTPSATPSGCDAFEDCMSGIVCAIPEPGSLF